MRQTLTGICILGGMFATPSLAQQPVITGLLNNYSFVEPGLPHYGIAQGSIFDIFGTNLSVVNSTALQSVPLPTTVGGVSATVTVNGVTAPLILYFVSQNQIAAILPSRVPVGTGQVVVTNSGVTPAASAPFPIQVVSSAFGMLTLDGQGDGGAGVFNAASQYLDFTHAVNPGEYITLWGSGLGPIAGDETQTQTPHDLSNIPIELDIGGIPATVTYHGRSIYPGLDQINAVVPLNLQPGCFVSVVVRTGNVVSNFASIPVAASGRTCSDAIFGVDGAQIQPLSASGFSKGLITITKDVATTPGAPGTATTTDAATAQFTNVPPDVYFVTMGGDAFAGLGASLGSCIVHEINVYGKINGLDGADFNTGTSLDAGSALNVTGPGGGALIKPAWSSFAMDSLYGTHVFYYYSGVFNAGFIPNGGGTFTFDHIPNDPESADIKAPIGAKITLPAPLAWTNQSSITSVNRSQGITVTWTGGDPGTYVSVSGSTTEANSLMGSYFNCSAPVAAGTFTVPAAVLLTLPPSPAPSSKSFLRVGNFTDMQNFTVTGVTVGLISGGYTFTSEIAYQ